MATVLSTLYPPLIDTFMPAFLREGPAPVSFSLSPYNDISKIKRIHVSLVNQKTNQSAFENNSKAVPTTGKIILDNIWIIPFNINNTEDLIIDRNNNVCIVNIPTSILKGHSFLINTYYKVQIRLDEASVSSEAEFKDTSYFVNKRQFFSEWSSVCLIKAIPSVDITMEDFYEDIYDSTTEGNTISKIRTVQAGIVPIAGNVKFTPKSDETLQRYHIEIISNKTEEVIDKTEEWVYTNNNQDPNRIYWLADLTNTQANEIYNIYITAITKNQYKFQRQYQLKIASFDAIPFTPKWTPKQIVLNEYGETSEKIITEEDGILSFTITSEEELPQGYLYVKRATSIDNFKKWELISCTNVVGKINKTIVDPTIGSLVKYRYACQFRLKKSGSWTSTKFSPFFVYPDYHDILIYRDGRQLAIRYNAQVTSYSAVVNRQVINTLGHKYPKFAENAQMNYKKFTITGLLTSEADFNREFLNDREYASEMNDYDQYMGGKYEVRNDTISDDTYTYATGTSQYAATQNATQYLMNNTLHDLAPRDNWWLERKFRDEALKWLNDGEPKLFKSMTEGNLVVMLTDISLTPNAQIGRRTYNISMTAYEIEDGYSLDVLSSLGIITVPNEYAEDMERGLSPDEIQDFDSETSVEVTTIGQLYNKQASPNNDNLIYFSNRASLTYDVTASDYTIHDFFNGLYYRGALSAYRVVDNSYRLKDLKIQFISNPQWYDLSDYSSKAISNIKKYISDYPEKRNNLLYGYKLSLIPFLNSINKEGSQITLFVEEKGYYQVPSNLVISGVCLYDNAVATLDYKLTYKREFDESSIPSSAEVTSKIVGQLSGRWDTAQRIADAIKNKYEYFNLAEDNSDKKGYNGILEMQYLDKITAFGFDGTSYTVLGIRFEGEEESETKQFVVGRTGVYNLMTDFPIEDVVFLGRRMVKKEEKENNSNENEIERTFTLHPSTQFYQGTPVDDFNWIDLDNGEEVTTLIVINGNVSQPTINQINKNWIDQDEEEAPFNSINDIVNPEINTVYAVYQDDDVVLMLYTDNFNWIQVDFTNEDNHTIMYINQNVGVNTKKKTPFLEEWEFRLDDSITENIDSNLVWYKNWLKTKNEVSINGTTNIGHSIININDINIPIIDGYKDEKDILNPEYNTIYKIQKYNEDTEEIETTNKIYYIDQRWYDIDFLVDDIILAKVPVYGMVNYRGNLVKIQYG